MKLNPQQIAEAWEAFTLAYCDHVRGGVDTLTAQRDALIAALEHLAAKGNISPTWYESEVRRRCSDLEVALGRAMVVIEDMQAIWSGETRPVPQCPVILRQLRQVLYATSPPPKESNES